jgi:hypothetical protein
MSGFQKIKTMGEFSTVLTEPEERLFVRDNYLERLAGKNQRRRHFATGS